MSVDILAPLACKSANPFSLPVLTRDLGTSSVCIDRGDVCFAASSILRRCGAVVLACGYRFGSKMLSKGKSSAKRCDDGGGVKPFGDDHTQSFFASIISHKDKR